MKEPPLMLGFPAYTRAHIFSLSCVFFPSDSKLTTQMTDFESASHLVLNEDFSSVTRGTS